MNEKIIPADKTTARWAAQQDFDIMAAVDTVYTPENLGKVRHWLLRQYFMPQRFHSILKGHILLLDQTPQGYLFLVPQTESIHIEALGINENQRRKGYGTLLVEKAEELAKEQEIYYLGVNMGSENNVAQAFCQKLGFRAYRPEGWTISDPDLLENLPIPEENTLREIKPVENHDHYERWLEHELDEGDAWIKPVIIEDHFTLSLRSPATTWLCMLDGEEKGYLRINGDMKKINIYFACERSLWESEQQAAWVKQGLASFPFVAKEIVLKTGSEKHHLLSKSVWESAGFTQHLWPRYLMFKALDKES